MKTNIKGHIVYNTGGNVMVDIILLEGDQLLSVTDESIVLSKGKAYDDFFNDQELDHCDISEYGDYFDFRDIVIKAKGAGYYIQSFAKVNISEKAGIDQVLMKTGITILITGHSIGITDLHGHFKLINRKINPPYATGHNDKGQFIGFD